MRTLGVVLAGGRSSRFGSDKAAAQLDGHSLLDLALAALRPHCDAVAIVGRPSEDTVSIADWPRPGMGPLGGIAGGLDYASAHGFEQILSIPVDCVRLPVDLGVLLEPAPSFLESQPVIGLWPVSATDQVRTLLADGRDLAVKAFARRVGARPVRCDFAPPNVNSAEDLERLAAEGERASCPN